MLNESRGYSFLDQEQNFAIHFLEGQRLIHDLALIHDVQNQGFLFFRNSMLSFQPMISFLKAGEGFGLYIDSEVPYFRFKIETNFSGTVRALMLPDELGELPEKITGVARLSKVFSGKGQPYTSVIQLNNLSIKELSNKILADSYQLDANVFVSDDADQSVLVVKLPRPNVDKEESIERPTTKEYFLSHQEKFNNLFKKSLLDEQEIIKNFEKDFHYLYLKSTEIKFKCSCSRERFLINLKSISNHNPQDLFDEGKNDMEVTCDYCKTAYLFTKNELLN